jgi:hypothetical protein
MMPSLVVSLDNLHHFGELDPYILIIDINNISNKDISNNISNNNKLWRADYLSYVRYRSSHLALTTTENSMINASK